MSQDLMDRIISTNDFYAPFKVLKYYEDHEGFVKGGSTNRIPSSEQLAKKITGIDDADVRIGSPLETAAEQVYKGYILAQKNRKLRQLAELGNIDGTGEYIKPIAPDQHPDKGFDRISYFEDGEMKQMQVSRQIADALNGMGVNETDIMLRSLGRFAKVFKMGATGLNIGFNIANAFMFDKARLAVMSKYGFRGPQDFIYSLYDLPHSLISAVRGNIGQYLGFTPDKLYETYIKSGAAGSTLARVMTPEAFGSRLPRDLKAKDLLAHNNHGAGTPLKVAALLSNSLEEWTKLLGLKRALRIEKLDALSPADRQKKMDEIVTEIRNYAGSPDFARMGVSMKALNIIAPFTNARWQGFLADFARINPFRQGNAKDAAATWAKMVGLIGLPAAGLAYLNLSSKENEADFKKIPQDERDRYFHIPRYLAPDGKSSLINYGRGGYYFKNRDGEMIRGYTRIPKREFPGLMANTVEDFISYVKDNDPEAFSKLAARFGDNFLNTASPVNLQGDSIEERILSAASGLNPAIRIPLEVAANKNYFTGQDIVHKRLVKASPHNQFIESTPEAYKQIASAMPDILPASIKSPMRLQHITEGFTGGFARQFAQPRLSEGNPALEVSPLLGRFYRSERIDDKQLTKAAAEAETARTDERLGEQGIAAKLARIIEARPTTEAKQKVIRDAHTAGILNENTMRYLKEELQDAQRGLGYEDRVVKRSFSVTGGYRARYYLQKLASLPADERGAYVTDQQKKGLLTGDVAQQMRAEAAKARSATP